jgi:CTP synthase
MPRKNSNRGLKYIFVVGGVMSGVGKGVTASSMGKILQSRGLCVTSIKIDPYVNVDAGTMNPIEHGEVFVLDDGTECDQDMGNYERFLGKDFTGANYITTGSIYLEVINKERNLEFGGKCVSVVPYIPMEVIERIDHSAKIANADVVLIEVGGTVGEYENILFLEAIRILKLKKPNDVLVALVSFIPSLEAGGNELKTKPTQHAVRNLNSVGIQPDIIFGRAPFPLDEKRKEKLSLMCGIEKEDVISAPNAESIYDIPLNFEKENLSGRLLKKLKLSPRGEDLKEWKNFCNKVHSSKKQIKIGVIGKYFDTGDFMLADSYISVLEAIKHSSYTLGVKPVIEWINSGDFEKNKSLLNTLSAYDGIIVPGGFGNRGIEGKISAIKYCREKKIPYFGLCYGMQLALIEYARNVLGFKNANTTEIDPKTKYPVIDILAEQKKLMADKKYGGTMRLGSYPAKIIPKSIAYKAYGAYEIKERHRHRYEVNETYIENFEKGGVIFSGISPDRRLMEIMELPEKVHPFFVGTQFHPELKSRPLNPHPLFLEFIKASIKRSNTKNKK